jgi:hypothetical protein
MTKEWDVAPPMKAGIADRVWTIDEISDWILPMKKYEYMVQTADNKKNASAEQTKELNLLGKEGWELVSTIRVTGVSDAARFYLRREISK